MINSAESQTDPCAFTTLFADGEYRFRLKPEGATELEEKCGAAFTVVFNRLDAARYELRDIRETIRLGLIGGGLAAVKAQTLVKRYVDERPLAESWLLARSIIGALLYGVASDPPPSHRPTPPPAADQAASPPDEVPAPVDDATSTASSTTLSAVMRSRFGNGQQP